MFGYLIKFDQIIGKHRINIFNKEKMKNFDYTLNGGYIFYDKRSEALFSVRKFLPSWTTENNYFNLKLWVVLESSAEQPYILINEDFGILLLDYCEKVSILSVNFWEEDFKLEWSRKMNCANKNKSSYYKPIPILGCGKKDEILRKASLRTLLFIKAWLKPKWQALY